MQFALLYFRECPSWHQALENLRQALRAEGVNLEVSLVRVEGEDHAQAVRFQGSPTICLSGNDLFPEQPRGYGLTCRLYWTEEGPKGWPTVNMIRQRLRWQSQRLTEVIHEAKRA